MDRKSLLPLLRRAAPAMAVGLVALLPALAALEQGAVRLEAAIDRLQARQSLEAHAETLLARHPLAEARLKKLEAALDARDILHRGRSLAEVQAGVEELLRRAFQTSGATLRALQAEVVEGDGRSRRLEFTIQLESLEEATPSLLSALAAIRPRIDLLQIRTRQNVTPLPGMERQPLSHDLVIEAHVDVPAS